MTYQLRNLLPGIIIILILAACIRFALAPITTLEFRSDTILFQIWGYSAHESGLLNMYDDPIKYLRGEFKFVRSLNYLPPYLYILYGAELVRRLLSHQADIGSPLASLLYKTPAIIFELATILLLSKIILQRAGKKWALVGAAIYAFLPGIFFTTAIWGQIDSIYTFFLMLTVWFIAKKRLLLASMFWTIAFFFKMQSLALLPLLIYEVVLTASPSLILKSALTGISIAGLLNFPFLLKGRILELLTVVLFAPGSYPRVSIGAFNIWWAAASGHGFVIPDNSYAFGLPLVVIGALYFILAACFILWFRSNIRSDESLWFTAAFLFFSFFMLPTEMHERYLFPFFALILPVLPSMKWTRILFAFMSITFFINLLIIWKSAGQNISGILWFISYATALSNTTIFIVTILYIMTLTIHHKDLTRSPVKQTLL